MKKLFLSLAVMATLLCSCSKSAADYVKESQALANEYQTLILDGKFEEASHLQEKIEKLSTEIKERCEKDPEFAQELLEAALASED